VFIAGIKSLKTTVDPLLGQAPDPDFVDEIKESVLAYVGVFGIHDMLVHNYGANRVLVSLHVEVSAETDIRESHDLIDRIERDLAEKLGIMAVIHMDPIETTNEKVNELRAMSQQILKDIDPSLSLHDFRIVDGPNHTNLIYDVLVPHKVKIANCELCEMIEQETKKRNPKYYTVVTVDKSFIGE
jgi:divalent metal cation (Fe/Co/Zn/Cd) transporter